MGSEKDTIINGGIDCADKRVDDRFKGHRAIAPTREYPYAGAPIEGNVHYWHSGYFARSTLSERN
jgi:hypothetical protein